MMKNHEVYTTVIEGLRWELQKGFPFVLFGTSGSNFRQEVLLLCSGEHICSDSICVNFIVTNYDSRLIHLFSLLIKCYILICNLKFYIPIM